MSRVRRSRIRSAFYLSICACTLLSSSWFRNNSEFLRTQMAFLVWPKDTCLAPRTFFRKISRSALSSWTLWTKPSTLPRRHSRRASLDFLENLSSILVHLAPPRCPALMSLSRFRSIKDSSGRASRKVSDLDQMLRMPSLCPRWMPFSLQVQMLASSQAQFLRSSSSASYKASLHQALTSTTVCTTRTVVRPCPTST